MSWSLTAAPDISDDGFHQWRDMLKDKVGIQLGDHQRQFLQSQLSIRMREIGEEDFSRYFERVFDTEDGQLEWSILLDRLVIKETSFFRHMPSLNYVCEYLQGKIIDQSLTDSFDIWSLGCSTGEEAYTLAMLTNEALELAKVDAYFSLIGTDVSRVAVSVARSACYPERKIAFVPSSLRYKYFTKRDRDYKFEHELADNICFSSANAIYTNALPNLVFDVIYCQNMLVYFEQALRHSLLDQVVKKLKPYGVLVIGLGEVTDWNNEFVERVPRTDVLAYVKRVDKTKSR